MTLWSQQIAANLYAVNDSCTVYLLVDPDKRSAVAIDAGSDRWLDRLSSYGVDTITDVLVTHHHRTRWRGCHD